LKLKDLSDIKEQRSEASMILLASKQAEVEGENGKFTQRATSEQVRDFLEFWD